MYSMFVSSRQACGMPRLATLVLHAVHLSAILYPIMYKQCTHVQHWCLGDLLKVCCMLVHCCPSSLAIAAAVARDRVANVLLAYKVRSWPAACSSSWCSVTPLATALKQGSRPFRLRAAC